MRKIANTTELQGELQRLLEYTRTEQPSREKLAADLRVLAARLAPQSAKVAARVPHVTGGSATKEKLIAALVLAANNIFDCRAETRPIYEALQDAKEFAAMGIGAIGRLPDDIYERTVKCRDLWNKLDWAMGDAAHGFEVLARDLKKATPKPY